MDIRELTVENCASLLVLLSEKFDLRPIEDYEFYDTPVLEFHDRKLADFICSWYRIKELYDNKTISNDLYDEILEYQFYRLSEKQ